LKNLKYIAKTLGNISMSVYNKSKITFWKKILFYRGMMLFRGKEVNFTYNGIRRRRGDSLSSYRFTNRGNGFSISGKLFSTALPNSFAGFTGTWKIH